MKPKGMLWADVWESEEASEKSALDAVVKAANGLIETYDAGEDDCLPIGPLRDALDDLAEMRGETT